MNSSDQEKSVPLGIGPGWSQQACSGHCWEVKWSAPGRSHQGKSTGAYHPCCVAASCGCSCCTSFVQRDTFFPGSFTISTHETRQESPKISLCCWANGGMALPLSLTCSSKGSGGKVGSSRNISSQSSAFMQRARLSTSLAMGPSIPATASTKVLSLQADGLVLSQLLVGAQHGRTSVRPEKRNMERA